MAILEFLMQEIWYDIRVYHLVIIGIVILFIVIYKKRKQLFGKKEKEYKEIILKDEITEEVKDILDVGGKKIFKEKRLLRIGYNIIGRITRIVKFHWDEEKTFVKNVKANKELQKLRDEVKGESNKNNFFLFEIIKKGMFGKIKYFFGFGKKYYLVDLEFVTNSPSEYMITPYAQYIKYFGNVYVFSKEGKKVIMNLADKLTLEQVLQEQVNFVPRMTFLEVRTAKFSAKARELSAIEKEKYASRIEALEKD